MTERPVKDLGELAMEILWENAIELLGRVRDDVCGSCDRCAHTDELRADVVAFLRKVGAE